MASVVSADAFRPVRLAARFMVFLVLFVALGSWAGGALLAPAAEGWHAALGSAHADVARTLAVLTTVLGGIGGALLGATFAAARGLSDLGLAMQAWGSRLPEPAPGDGPSWPVAELRQRYEQILAHATARLPLPGLVADRLVRPHLGQPLVEDLLVHCERSGMPVVGVSQVRHWLIARSPDALLAPLRAQVRTWRLAMGLLLAAVAAAPWVVYAVRGPAG